jgi:hypothetical protein
VVRRESESCVIFHSVPTRASMNASVPQWEKVSFIWKV